MEHNEISLHEIKVFMALESRKQWVTNLELATELKMSPRTVRYKTKKFVDLGLIDMAEVFPAHKYKYSDKADKRNIAYVKRIKQAAEVFGL